MKFESIPGHEPLRPDGSNYHYWKDVMEIYLDAKDISDFVKPGHEPHTYERCYPSWERVAHYVIGLLTLLFI